MATRETAMTEPDVRATAEDLKRDLLNVVSRANQADIVWGDCWAWGDTYDDAEAADAQELAEHELSEQRRAERGNKLGSTPASPAVEPPHSRQAPERRP